MKMIKMRNIVKKAASLIMAAALAIGAVSGLMTPASAADLPEVSYEYSEEVHTGTIRFISQNDGKTNNSPRSGYFDDRYWGNWVNGGANSPGPGYECGTASISMALSYVGINKTPEMILAANNGITYFTGWGADFLNVSISDGLSNLASGNGKYSPVIIHIMTGSSGYPNGHYVLVVGQSSEGSFEILDCNRDSIWTLTAGDYLYGRIDGVYQYYNADAVIEPKASVLPEGVLPTSLNIKVERKNGTVVRAGAGNKETITGRIQKGTVITAIGYTVNKWGNVWYYLEDGTYVFGKNVAIESAQSTARITGVSAPSGNLPSGGIYVLKGNVTSSCNRLVQITATVKTESGNVVLEATDRVDGQYSLQSSALDKAMTFNTLPSGSYVYEITVEEDVDAGTLCMPLHTVLYTSSFTVS